MTEPGLLDHTLAALVAAYVLYATLRGQPKAKELEFTTATKLSTYWANGTVLWLGAIAAAAVWLLAGRTLGSLGLTIEHESPGIGVAIAVAFVAWFAFETYREIGTPARRAALRARWQRDCPFMPETPRELGHFTYVAVTAGITEEIIARGFLISYVGWYTGSTMAGIAAAVAIPALVFAVAHRYQGRALMLRILVLALFFGAIFVVTGSLLIPIVLHALVDLAGGVLSYRLASGGQAREHRDAP
ncbi:MAG: CPBP family intramembrane metalloprotease [Phycisphaerales bacterium]|nr:CPBP family intramembrane metalloprotease [Phycisphaerae bacterium]NNF41865.1 CPBP family intramembrane metalloprotease [Phycisphaerales bacterium]NNM25978.1 CPBP family intramembrane metalloprotease [Phycisphaerales bacterium]